MGRTKKKVLVRAGLVIVAAAAVGLFFFYKIQMTWVESPPYRRVSSAPVRTLVVVYSRTGNTLGAAKEVARIFDADVLQIEAPQYGRTLAGQRLAGKHADVQLTTTPIQHDPVDLSRYDLVFLCSPTWWFRPAVPLWSFVENHDFSGTSVFLLMTGNSRLKEELTGKLGTMVEQRGGKFLDTLFIRRGRIYWQKTSGEVSYEVREALEARRGAWPLTAGSTAP